MQKNKIIRYIVLVLFLIMLSFFITIELDATIINTLYTVAGIMFSIGMSIVVTFNMQGIKNRKYILEVRKQLNYVLNNYIIYFSICTISFLLDSYIRKNSLSILKWEISHKIDFTLSFNTILFLCLILIYSIIYFVFNFIQIQKLNNSIFDELNK